MSEQEQAEELRKEFRELCSARKSGPMVYGGLSTCPICKRHVPTDWPSRSECSGHDCPLAKRIERIVFLMEKERTR